MQTRRHSIIEAITNVIVGYVMAVVAQIIIFPWFGIAMPLGASMKMGLIFTLLSLVRNYTLRRIFNLWSTK